MCGEFFYFDEHGRKQDRELHEAILDNPRADAAARRISFEIALRMGMNEAAAALLYGIGTIEDNTEGGAASSPEIKD